MTSSTSAAADLEELRRFALDLEDRHLHGKRANIDDAFKWNQVVRIIGKLAALEAQQTDTLSELRTQIEEIYTPDADFKDQVLELLGAKKACFWEALEGVPGKLWCLTHDTDHGLDSAKAEGKE